MLARTASLIACSPFSHRLTFTCPFLLKLLFSNQFEQALEERSDFPRQLPPTTYAANFLPQALAF
jgi:hypothetical protein